MFFESGRELDARQDIICLLYTSDAADELEVFI